MLLASLVGFFCSTWPICYGLIHWVAWLLICFCLTEWAIDAEDWLAKVSGPNGDILSLSTISAAPLAFIAGLISFISPWCVTISACLHWLFKWGRLVEAGCIDSFA